MKFKCTKCPYECVLEMKQAPKYEDSNKFATCCIYDAGLVEWEVVDECNECLTYPMGLECTKKKNLSEQVKIWCTKCDIELNKNGIALDCPDDGTFYECPTCNYRIVIFKKGV